MIKNLTTYIESKTAFVLGTNLFAAYRPKDAPDNCVLVAEPTPERRDFDLPDKREKAIQVLARHRDYYLAKAWAESVMAAVIGKDKAGFTIDGVPAEGEFIVNAAQGTGPAYIGEDERGRHQFSGNMMLQIQNAE